MINVRIKQTPPSQPGGKPNSVTSKVFLRPGREQAKGCRPLEPGEVVALEDDEARRMLAYLPFEVEITLEPATRPLYFSNFDQAQLTSQYYNVATAGRAEAAKAAMQQALEEASKPANVAAVEIINSLSAREAAIIAKEIELGLRPAPIGDLIEDDDDLDADVPANNAVSMAELKQERAAVAEKLTVDAAATVASRRRRKTA